MPMYLKIKGAIQGDIKGSVTRKGRENWIEVITANHEIVSPRDVASGQASGRRQHKQFVVTKVVDQSTPALYAALTKNEQIKEWLLESTAVELTGVERVVYRVKLTNAFVAGIAFDAPGTDDLTRGKLMERVSWAYEKIEWTWVPTNATTSDNWVN